MRILLLIITRPALSDFRLVIMVEFVKGNYLKYPRPAEHRVNYIKAEESNSENTIADKEGDFSGLWRSMRDGIGYNRCLNNNGRKTSLRMGYYWR